MSSEQLPTDHGHNGATLQRRSFTHWLHLFLCFVALLYALIAGLRTVTDWDLGWQLATGRWVIQHHQIPSIDVFSYTAAGQPWVYPVGSGIILYGTFLTGGYALLSWIGAAACAGTVALLVRRGSLVTAALAILAVPPIALRTAPRADMFSVVLFAAVLALLWQQHETGRARLWLLPLLMVAWVNLHLGLMAGLALLAGYVLAEVLELFWPERRKLALERLRRSWPWLAATCAVTLVNPWGWGIYQALFRQQSAMESHSQLILEWAPAQLSWTRIAAHLSLHNPDSFVLMLLVTAVALPTALLRRQFGAAVILGGAAYLGIRHLRFQSLFVIVVVIVAGAVLSSALGAIRTVIADARLRSLLALAVSCLMTLLVWVWSADLVTNRSYLGSTDIASFGTGLSWWFPENAMAFIQRENIPGEIFNSYTEGGYITWRLGPKYRDYIDGRAIPFGSELLEKNIRLMGTPPDSPQWQSEAWRYNINAIVVPLARFQALEQFPFLPQFCTSANWRPVYLDENSAVFLRRRPETESLIQRLEIDCATVPVPAVLPTGNDSRAFNQFANAAAVLKVLGRSAEAFAATSRALAIFPGSAYVHFTRAGLLAQVGDLRNAELQYLAAATLEPNAVSWASLARMYERENRLDDAIKAWDNVADLAPDPYLALLSQGFDNLETRHPQQALLSFDRSFRSLPSKPLMGIEVDKSYYANLAHGRAMSWKALGNFKQAISFEEETLRLTPDRSDDWLELAALYEHEGRAADAQRAREHAAPANANQNTSGSRR